MIHSTSHRTVEPPHERVKRLKAAIEALAAECAGQEQFGFAAKLRGILQSDEEFFRANTVPGKWKAVDLDDTLAEWVEPHQGATHIGPPIMPMVNRVRRMLASGEDVRIFTARIDGGFVATAMGNPLGAEYADTDAICAAIEAWCLEHLGQVLPITNVKDFGCERIYDDKAVTVRAKTGELLAPEQLSPPEEAA